ncbi:hypothetical protein V6N13_135965 [Hibiscus sabdariffa]
MRCEKLREQLMTAYEDAMYEVQSISSEAYDWLIGRDPRKWSKTFFSPRTKCDMLLNNLCESFDKVAEANKWTGPLCPKIQKKLETTIQMSARCWPTDAGGNRYQHARTASAPTQQARKTTTNVPHHQQATIQPPPIRTPKMQSSPTQQDQTTTSVPAQQASTQPSSIQDVRWMLKNSQETSTTQSPKHL